MWCHSAATASIDWHSQRWSDGSGPASTRILFLKPDACQPKKPRNRDKHSTGESGCIRMLASELNLSRAEKKENGTKTKNETFLSYFITYLCRRRSIVIFFLKFKLCKLDLVSEKWTPWKWRHLNNNCQHLFVGTSPEVEVLRSKPNVPSETSRPHTGCSHIRWIARTLVLLQIQGLQRIAGITKVKIDSLQAAHYPTDADTPCTSPRLLAASDGGPYRTKIKRKLRNP
jgi:hypothetical protein